MPAALKNFMLRIKAVFVIGCVALVWTFAIAEPAGQRGGKAEPLRIEFKRGTTTTTINGVVRGDEEAEYVLAAKKGQHLKIVLTSVPAKTSVFQILGEDNDTLGLEHDAAFTFIGVLPKTGDYFISVKRPTERKGTSRYRMTITIK